MKNKKEFQQNNLTAAERKEKRRLEQEKQSLRSSVAKKDDSATFKSNAASDASQESVSDAVGAVETGFGQRELNRKKFWVIFTVGAMALIMILFAILVPFVIAPNLRFRDIEHPVIVFTLSNGDRIEIVVYENVMPHTASNFIHLARIGFFNDTIIFDATNGFVRFGQFEDATFNNHRTLNPDFLRRVNDITLPQEYVDRDTFDSPFDFRINETAQPGLRANDRGRVSLIHNFSGTDFQISTRMNAVTLQQTSRPGANDTLDLQGRVFGHVTNSSLDALDRINLLAQPHDARVSDHPFFTPTSEIIYIRRTNWYNLDFWGKWRTFNWDEHFGRVENRAAISWHGGSGWGNPRGQQWDVNRR